MDKIILNSNMLPGKVGQPGTIEDLKRLSKLLKMDVANFGGKNFEGFPTGIADRIADVLDRDYNKDTSTVCVFNDIALEQTYSLLSRGYKLKNIYLVFGKWERHGRKVTASLDMTSFEIVKEYLKNNFKNKFNLLNLSDVYNTGNNNMNKFDLVIANPPYALGNEITRRIMECGKKAVVIMPHSAFISGDLYRRVDLDSAIYMSKAESQTYFDAAVPPLTIGTVHQYQTNDLDAFEWKLRDASLTIQLIYDFNRKHADCCELKGAILRHSNLHVKDGKSLSAFDPGCFQLYSQADYERSLVFGIYYVENGLHKDDGDAADNQWNYKLKSYQEFQDWMLTKDKRSDLHKAQFKTPQEKINVAYWMYKEKLYSLILKQLSEAGASGTIEYIKYITIPHIDWSHTDITYTDEYVLNQMGLKWNERRDGVEKL